MRGVGEGEAREHGATGTGLRHLPGAPVGAGWGKEGKRHGEADEEPGRGRLEARQRGQAPLQLEKQLPEGKGTTPGLRLHSLHSEHGPPTAPRTVLSPVLDLGLLPEQSGMQISTCEAKSSVSPHQAATPSLPPGSLCPRLAYLRAGGPGWPSWQDVTSTRNCACSATSGMDLSLSSAPASSSSFSLPVQRQDGARVRVQRPQPPPTRPSPACG